MDEKEIKLDKMELAILIESGGLFDYVRIVKENKPKNAISIKKKLIARFIDEYKNRTSLTKEELEEYVYYVIERTEKNLENIEKADKKIKREESRDER